MEILKYVASTLKERCKKEGCRTLEIGTIPKGKHPKSADRVIYYSLRHDSVLITYKNPTKDSTKQMTYKELNDNEAYWKLLLAYVNK